MRLANVKKGDTIFVVFSGYRRNDKPRTESKVVTAAGPKYVTAGGDRFHRETGAIVTQYTPRTHAFTCELDWATEEEDSKARTRLDRLLRDTNPYRIRRPVVDELIRILSSADLE